MRMVAADGRVLWRVLMASIDASWVPCSDHSGETEVVPVATIRVE